MHMTHPSDLSSYQRIGGDAVTRRLANHFHELMDALPKAYAARKVHPISHTAV